MNKIIFTLISLVLLAGVLAAYLFFTGVASDAPLMLVLAILVGVLAAFCLFGLYMVELKATGQPIGICGLVQRDYLADADVGFAFLPEFWSRGYAFESAAAVKAFAFETLGLARVLAITSPDNVGSIRVLQKIGLEFEGMIKPPADAAEVRLFSSDN
jgi:hypothetical protein